MLDWGSPNNRSLAFYGDALLDMLIVDRINFAYGLDIDPDSMTKLRITMVSNAKLLDISRQLDVCQGVFNISNSRKLDKHNVCADSLEAILGVLYFQYGMPAFHRIKKWFFSLVPIEETFENEMSKLYLVRQQVIGERNYIPDMQWNAKASVDDFLSNYLKPTHKRNLELVEEPLDEANNLYSYYLRNVTLDRDYYLDSLVKGDKAGLKQALIDKGVWVPI